MSVEINRWFVVGTNRSGTKWLTNCLIAHPLLTGVTAHRHGGVIECDALADLPRMFPKFEFEEQFAAFVELWCATDFVIAAGISSSDMYAARPRPTNCYAAFVQVMDEVARRRGVSGWVHKCSPPQAMKIAREIPGVRFVAIYRDPYDIVISTRALGSETGRASGLVRVCVDVIMQLGMLEHVSKHEHALCVDYEELVSDRAAVLRAVFEGMALPVQEEAVVDAFGRNTSFAQTTRPRRRAALALAINWACRLMGLIGGRMVYFAWRTFRSRRPIAFVRGTFSERLPDTTFRHVGESKAE